VNTETEKTKTEYLRWKSEPNRTKIEKSKPTLPYRQSVSQPVNSNQQTNSDK